MLVKIYNSLGHLVFRNNYASLAETPVHIDQPAGLYMVVIEVNGEVFKDKLVID